MKKYKHGHPAWHHQLNSLFFAGLFIVSGSLLLARNLGLLSPYVFSLWVSWPTLLIAWGILQLIKSHISSGLILAAVGSYFLLPRIQGMDMSWISLYWPVFLIIAGIWLLTKMWRHKNQFHNKQENYTSASYTTTEGFVQSEITFGGTEHIVLDPVFNGAHIINTFGATLLDLRHTRLEQEKTYIDIECVFGGIELYIPSEWKLSILTDTTLAGYTDKRCTREDEGIDHINTPKELIIRGKLVFSGLEIKS